MRCHHCGSPDTTRAGVHIKKTGRFQRWKCKKCGRISIGGRKKNEIHP